MKEKYGIMKDKETLIIYGIRIKRRKIETAFINLTDETLIEKEECKNVKDYIKAFENSLKKEGLREKILDESEDLFKD